MAYDFEQTSALDLIDIWQRIEPHPVQTDELAEAFTQATQQIFEKGRGADLVAFVQASNLSNADQYALLADMSTALMDVVNTPDGVCFSALIGISVAGSYVDVQKMDQQYSVDLAEAIVPWMGKPDDLHIKPLGVLRAHEALSLATSPGDVWQMVSNWRSEGQVQAGQIDKFKAPVEDVSEVGGFVLMFGVFAVKRDAAQKQQLRTWIDYLDEFSEDTQAGVVSMWEDDVLAAGFLGVPLGLPCWVGPSAVEGLALCIEMKAMLDWSTSNPGQQLPQLHSMAVSENKKTQDFDVVVRFDDGTSLTLYGAIIAQYKAFIPIISSSFTCRAVFGDETGLTRVGDWSDADMTTVAPSGPRPSHLH